MSRTWESTSRTLLHSPINMGRILENVVFLHLRRDYKEIYYFQQTGECDFVVIKRGQAEFLIQVCYDLNDMNVKRETKGLFEVMEFFKKTEGMIITFNQTDVFREEDKEIRVIPAWEWMQIR